MIIVSNRTFEYIHVLEHSPRLQNFYRKKSLSRATEKTPHIRVPKRRRTTNLTSVKVVNGVSVLVEDTEACERRVSWFVGCERGSCVGDIYLGRQCNLGMRNRSSEPAGMPCMTPPANRFLGEGLAHLFVWTSCVCFNLRAFLTEATPAPKLAPDTGQPVSVTQTHLPGETRSTVACSCC